MLSNEGIAIVGIDCRYPGAHNTGQYWENILALRQQFRPIPRQRLNLADYYTTDKAQVDSTYSQKAAVLQGYHFDRSKYKVAKSTFEQTDMAHWLALDVADGALRDAGFENGNGLDKQRVGVIVGNSLTGEFTRANVLRLRWPYVAKIMAAALGDLQYASDDIGALLAHAEGLFKEPFPAPDADMLAGGLSNTIAGRICNYYDFNGGGFTVDGACASSLLAFENGCRSIESGNLDVAIVGGVDLSIDPFEIIGFARNGALATHEMDVYGAKAAGFWPGEGCGMAVLMRTSEAIRRGANIYAVIKGWGISSDGNGGITRPKAETQALAFARAYERAGYGINDVALFEGHGTGTTLGDKVELEAITGALLRAGKTGQPATLGSVKQLIGHTKAAAGVAGTIKACMALKTGIIPASRPVNAYNSVLTEQAGLLQLIHTPRYWTQPEPMRASISAMGFGGINVHLTLEQAVTSRKVPRPTTTHNRLVRSYRDSEVFPLSHPSKEGLLQQISRLKTLASVISRAEFVDLASTLCAGFRRAGAWNASLVAATPDQLAKSLDTLAQHLQTSAEPLVNTEEGIFFRMGTSRQKIAFLFPGQGAPVYPDHGAFAAVNASAVSGQTTATGPAGTDAVVDTAVAQPAIVASSLASVQLLEQYGIEGDLAIGHSLGELSALSWAGAYDRDDAVELARERGAAMSTYGEKNGAMLALKCSREVAETLVANGRVCITGFNGPDSYVIGGPLSEVDAVQQEAVRMGLHNVRLKVSHAFHTPMMRPAAAEFRQYLDTRSFGPLQRAVVSTVTAELLPEDTELTDLLFTQIEQPVRFIQAIQAVGQTIDYAFELGPGSALTRSLDGYGTFHRLALNYGGSSLKSFLSMLSAGFMAGHDVLFEELVAERFYRPFDLEGWQLDVFVNPCEKIERPTAVFQRTAAATAAPVVQTAGQSVGKEATGAADQSLAGIQAYITQLISDKTEIPLDVIGADDKLMSQLHINSLAITEIITLVIRQFNKSQLVFSEASVLANADGTIAELSQVIFAGEPATVVESERSEVDLDTLPNWTHVFRREAVAVSRPQLSIDNGPVQVNVAGRSSVNGLIEQALQTSALRLGKVAVFVCEAEQTDESLFDFVQFLNRPDVRQANLVALLTLGTENSSESLVPVLRTFQLEVPTTTVLSLTLPAARTDLPALLLAELNSTTKYKEVAYDEAGVRSESRVTVFFPQAGVWNPVLGTNDVLLATGGGKGITFESVRYIAQQTGAKLAIFGRAVVDADSELAANLAQLTTAGLTYRYYSVDVRDAAAVSKAMAHVNADLGPVTALLHGAGVNKPKLLNQLTPPDFISTQLVKVDGLRNVVNALDMDQLRLVVGYGSIIAESGMFGNADYAWANDKLAQYIQTLGQTHPHCRCLTLEWSVWAETGMGVSLNTLETLRQKGVYSIPVSQGLEVLRQVLTDTTLQAGRLIVSGRYGNLPTLTYHRHAQPTGRFVTNLKNHTPGVEIVASVPVNTQDDLYLNNHVFQGQYVFPTVMILEGVAQLTRVLAAHEGTWTFENLTIRKPIFVPQAGSNMLRFVITRLAQNSFRAVVQSEDSNFEVDCFEMVVSQAETPMPTFEPGRLPTAPPLDLDVHKTFYDALLFHQGPFRRVDSFYEISSTKSLARAKTSLTDSWFGPYMPDTYVLGDAGLNDAAIHCHQVCRPGGSLLPSGAARIMIDPNPTDEPLFIRTIETYDDARQTIIDVYLVTQSGVVKQYWNGLILSQVSGTGFKGEWNAHLLAPYIEYNLTQRYGQSWGRIGQSDCARLFEGVRLSDKAVCTINDVVLTLRKARTIEPKDSADRQRLNFMPEPYIISPLSLLNLDGEFALEVCQTLAGQPTHLTSIQLQEN